MLVGIVFLLAYVYQQLQQNREGEATSSDRKRILTNSTLIALLTFGQLLLSRIPDPVASEIYTSLPDF